MSYMIPSPCFPVSSLISEHFPIHSFYWTSFYYSSVRDLVFLPSMPLCKPFLFSPPTQSLPLQISKTSFTVLKPLFKFYSVLYIGGKKSPLNNVHANRLNLSGETFWGAYVCIKLWSEMSFFCILTEKWKTITLKDYIWMSLTYNFKKFFSY